MSTRDFIVCDHMPHGLALVSICKHGIYQQFIPHRTSQGLAAAEGDVTLEPDADTTVSLASIIPGYARLR